jgi:hypothetical protein
VDNGATELTGAEAKYLARAATDFCGAESAKVVNLDGRKYVALLFPHESRPVLVGSVADLREERAAAQPESAEAE